ncbi:MAG: hypothetical protein EBW14_22405, partial [Oxalobacteraceae bacterium]|nr:hypothetical protein [Oxalobacteraceae bacterium]
TLRNETYLEELLVLLQERVGETAEETLGEAFENPSREDLARLTPVLIEKHGKLATSVYYCFVIHMDFDAAPLLEEFFAPGAIFEVREDDSPSVPLVRPQPRAVDDATRSRRRERRAKRKNLIFPAPPPVFRKRRKVARQATNDQLSKSVGDAGAAPSQIQLKKLEHPHVQTLGGLSTSDYSVGAIVNAYILYDPGKPEGGGKTRPCVVIAASEHKLLVRLVFSRPWRYAGNWRSVRIDDWRSAGLKNQSYVSTERRMVRRQAATFEGRLTTKDWNRICRGEVNSEGNP